MLVAVVGCLVKLPASGGNAVDEVRCGPVLAGHGVVVVEFDDDVLAGSADGDGQARCWGRGCLLHGVCDEPVDGLLDGVRKPFGGQLHDRDRARGMFYGGAYGACESVGGQGGRADAMC